MACREGGREVLKRESFLSGWTHIEPGETVLCCSGLAGIVVLRFEDVFVCLNGKCENN